MTETALTALIAQGENHALEFKSAQVHPDSLARELVALANTHGGVILLGVEDSGEIAGLPTDKNYEEWVLIRVGSTNRVATQAELMRLFQQSGMFHYDLQGVERTSIRDLNLAQIDDYFSAYQIDQVARQTPSFRSGRIARVAKPPYVRWLSRIISPVNGIIHPLFSPLSAML
jgi:ATP-dependent DNA helicase RecG